MGMVLTYNRDMKYTLPSYVTEPIRMLNEAGYEAYLVGGAVRSMVLNRQIHDYDITTSATPSETEQVFHDYRVIETGIKHGTVTVISKGIPLEITTYRTEGTYQDHRHPDHVSFTRSLKEDCARRDFTINALCLNPEEGFRDFFGGIQDCRDHIIRAIGDPDERFHEDALRIIRAVRFASQLGFTIEQKTADAVHAHLSDLAYVAMERINAELIRTLEGPYFKDVLKDWLDLFAFLMPETGLYDSSTKEAVYTHIAHSPDDAIIRIALLLQPAADPQLVHARLRKLKFTNQFIDRTMDLIRSGNMPLTSRKDILYILNRIRIPFPAYVDYRKSIMPSLDKDEILQQYQKLLNEKACWSIHQLSISGNDLIALGYRGKEISAALQKCLEEVMEGRLPNNKDVLLEYLRKQKS